MAVLRSLAFYVCFYLGSIGYVLAALAFLPFDAARFRTTVRRWGRVHRACVTGLLGARLVIDGEVVDGPVPRPASTGAMGQSVYCRDPDGNLVELLTVG